LEGQRDHATAQADRDDRPWRGWVGGGQRIRAIRGKWVRDPSGR